MINKITTYFGEVGQEFSKVSWPTREELFGSTGVVIGLCVVLSLLIWASDSVLSLLLKVLF